MSRLRNIIQSIWPRSDYRKHEPFGASDQPPAGTLKIPAHVAVVIDGNGRWARRQKLPRSAGHRAGAENLHRLCDLCIRYQIKYVTVYAFSTENWSRPSEEVKTLMDLFVEFFNRYDDELADRDIRLRFSGDEDDLPDHVLKTMRRAEAVSEDRKTLQLIVAFNYGSRRELVEACRRICRSVQAGSITVDQISEQTLSDSLYIPDIPDPDLIIRPSGEMRLSNFLLWQAAYAELWFSDVLWPDFNESHFVAALEAYTHRDRRFGGVQSS